MRYDADKSGAHSPGSLSSLAHSLGANPTHLAAAQVLIIMIFFVSPSLVTIVLITMNALLGVAQWGFE